VPRLDTRVSRTGVRTFTTWYESIMIVRKKIFHNDPNNILLYQIKQETGLRRCPRVNPYVQLSLYYLIMIRYNNILVIVIN
jgi:hypothetical protein